MNNKKYWMHNRDMIWNTADGRSIPIKKLTSAHLTNVLKHLDLNFERFTEIYGEKHYEAAKHNIVQEIRMRKLNRIQTNNNQENIF